MSLTRHLPGELRRLLRRGPRNRYEHLVHFVAKAKPRSMLEIGVWRGDRSEQFLQRVPELQDYVGLDLFEEIDSTTYQKESMGKCHPSTLQQVQSRLENAARNGTRIRLIRGRTDVTMPQLVQERPHSFDLIYLDGGHSLETVQNDWDHSLRLLRGTGWIVLDDYYLNDATRGAKPLVDGLLGNPRFRVRFFPVIEDIVEDLQITMVSVQVLSGQPG
jgi:hypothetical protein